MIFGTLPIVSLYIAVVVLIYSLHICPLKALSRGLWTRLLLALFPSINFDHTQIGYNSAVCSRFPHFSSTQIFSETIKPTKPTHPPTQNESMQQPSLAGFRNMRFGAAAGAPPREPTPLYNVDFAWLEENKPATLAFCDQFSENTNLRPDIFWIDNSSFIIISQRAQEKIRVAVKNYWDPCVPTPKHLKIYKVNPVMNIFVRRGVDKMDAAYDGEYEMKISRQMMRLSLHHVSGGDVTASLDILRMACKRPATAFWRPVAGLPALLQGQIAEVVVVRMKRIGEDEELLRLLRSGPLDTMDTMERLANMYKY